MLEHGADGFVSGRSLRDFFHQEKIPWANICLLQAVADKVPGAPPLRQWRPKASIVKVRLVVRELCVSEEASRYWRIMSDPASTKDARAQARERAAWVCQQIAIRLSLYSC